MKKFLPVVLAVIVLAGIGWYLSKPTAAPVSVPSVFGSIKDAMESGQMMQCTYVPGTSSQGTTSTVFVDGKKYKTETVASGAKKSVLSDGETQYVWTSGEKQGFSMSKACLAELKSLAPDTKTNSGSIPPKPTDSSAASDTAQNVNCVKTTGIDFAVPQDVVFTDQCALLK